MLQVGKNEMTKIPVSVFYGERVFPSPLPKMCRWPNFYQVQNIV